ncbi:unnamed protein product [Parnassius apollo]|uniref:(apollo) hypothetical protein n=1 Tax=Parnassius apollo TaxID=110799 RepID=A0A8S3Y6W4_PARAO|nr:unnamed protein product [Parnassius apollo]
MVGFASSALFLWGGSCGGAPWLVSGGAAIALVSALLMACLYIGAVASLAAYAPYTWLYTDIVLSTGLGILLLVSAILSMTFCDMAGVVDYAHGPLAIVNAGMITGSAVITYVSVMQRLDSSRGPGREPQPSQPTEHEV